MLKVRKITLILILIVGINNLNAGVNVVKNKDKPLKGEWDLALKEVWRIDRAGDTFMANVFNIRVDKNGMIYYLDTKYPKVFILNPDGTLFSSFGRRGEGPGEFRGPIGLHVTGKFLIVQDQGNELKVFNNNGDYKKMYKLGRDVSPRTFVNMHQYITLRSDFDKIQTWETLELIDLENNKGTVLATLAAETKVRASGQGPQGRIRITTGGTYTSTRIIIHLHKNKLYFGRNDKYVITRMNLEGKEEMAFSIEGRKRKPVSLQYKKDRIAAIKLRGGRMSKEMEKQLIDGYSDEFNYFTKITTDEKGMIYVYVTDVENITGWYIDIFSPEGKYLYHSQIKLPPGLQKRGNFVLKQNHIYAYAEDEDGNAMIVKYKITKPPQ